MQKNLCGGAKFEASLPGDRGGKRQRVPCIQKIQFETIVKDFFFFYGVVIFACFFFFFFFLLTKLSREIINFKFSFFLHGFLLLIAVFFLLENASQYQSKIFFLFFFDTNPPFFFIILYFFFLTEIFFLINSLSFVTMVGKIMNYPEIFKQHFIDSFIELSDDRVVNVRITLAKILRKHFQKKGNSFFYLFFRKKDPFFR